MRKKFFLLLFGAIIAFVALRYHESQFESQTGRMYDVMEFELPGSAAELTALIQLWQDPPAKNFVLQQLYIDFFFMGFLFPAIACLCFWGAERLQKLQSIGQPRLQGLGKLVRVIGYAQFAALFFDISENIRLIVYIQEGVAADIFLFETMVRLKFIIAFGGIVIGLVTIMVSAVMLASKRTKQLESLS
jgi:hypothetical protein